MSEVTRLLNAISQGDRTAPGELLPFIYQELKMLARARMARERPQHTLQATALVHEAYLRLVEDGNPRWENQAHFFAAASEAMRRILVEHARRKHALKNGGGKAQLSLSEEFPEIAGRVEEPEDLLALDEALAQLESRDAHLAELVKLLFFAGFSLDEAADALNISRTTCYRQWTFARAWLYQAINGAAVPG